MSVPLDEFKAVRTKFDLAGVDLYAYNLSFRDDFTDSEIERCFEVARRSAPGDDIVFQHQQGLAHCSFCEKVSDARRHAQLFRWQQPE